MKVLIVEDEPYARIELMRLLEKVPQEISIAGYADSIEDTVEWINQNPAPDLMFFDIQLSDGLSFEIFNQVKIKTSVIFTTAFDEYAIQAFKVNSIDYLLKPVKLADLKNALNKFESLKDQFGNEGEGGLKIDQIEKLLDIHKPRYKSRFVVKMGDLINHVEIGEIAYFKAEDNEVLLVTDDNKRYVVDYSLEQLIGLVNPDEFFRANRSYLVKLKSIKKISKYFNSRLHLELNPETEEQVLISRVKVPDFMNWMDK